MGTRLDGLHWLQAAAAVSGEMALQAISVLLEKLTPEQRSDLAHSLA